MDAQAPVHVHEYHDDLERFIHFYNINRDKNLVLIQTGCQKSCHSVQVRPRVRDHYLLHFVRSGSGCLHVRDASYQVNANDCFLIYPNELSSYHSLTDKTWSYYWIGIAGTFAEELISRAGFGTGRQALHFADMDIFNTLAKLVDAAILYQNDSFALDLKTNSLLYQLFSTLYLEGKEKRLTFPPAVHEDNSALFGIGGSSQQWVRTVTALIQDNYGENLKVDSIADYLHLNRSYLSSLFKQETGFSIKQYLSYYRIEAAKKKLLNTSDSISQISFQCGFQDPLYFSRIFREWVGLTPSEFRQPGAAQKARPPQHFIPPANIELPPQVDDYFLTY